MKLSATDTALLSDRERKMVQSTGPWQVKDLVSLIKRLRDLRDKQRDLQQRQRIRSARTSGSKDGRSGKANARTGDKAKVLDRALKHFEAELARLDRDSSSAMRALGGGTAAAPNRTPKKTPKKAPTNKAGKGERKATRKAVKAATGAAAVKTPGTRKAAETAASKPAARKAVTRKAAGKNATAREATTRKATGNAANKAAAPRGPAKAVSGKTRIRIPRSLGSAASRQRVSQASRRTRARKTR